MTAISMPTTPGLVSSRFGLETNTQSFVSPFTRAVQRVALGGSRWTATFTLPPMNRDRAAAWQAFFLKLEGGANTFYGFDPDAKVPRGLARSNPGTPQVNGAGQTGNAVNVDNCPLSVTGWLLPGSYFGVNGELKMVTGPVNTNGSGQATIPFMPPFRSSPPDNASITLNQPTCEMALADDQQAIWECDVRGIYQPKTFTAIEVFS